MHGVDADEPRPSLRAWRTSDADQVTHGVGGHKVRALCPVVRALAQVVEVRHRELGQTHVARIAVEVKCTFEQVRDRRTADLDVRLIHLD